MKNHTRFRWILAGLVVLLTVVGLIILNTQPVRYTKEQARANQRQLINNYLDGNKNPNKWWLTTASKSQPEQTAKLLDAKKRHLQEVLTKYKGVNPLATKIADQFKEFFVSIEDHGQSYAVATAAGWEPTGTEICFVPQDKYDERRFPSSLFWNERWRAMMIIGLEWPEPFLAGILFHELGHGLRFHERQADKNVLHGEAAYTAEEIDMHELELAIIDRACDGKYKAKLQAIVKKHDALDWPSLFAVVSLNDLHELDQVIGSSSFGSQVGQAVCAQHLLSLGLCQLEHDGSPAEQKTEIYRWLAQGMR